MRLFGLGSRKTSLYESLIRAYAADLYRFAYWLCRDRAVAEDLIQETCLRAWKNWASLKDAQAAKYWLFTILRREHARLYACHEPEQVWVEDEQALELLAGHCEQPPLEVREALLLLPESYRLPLLLQTLGGFAIGEIAVILEITEDAALARVSRARRKMRDILDETPSMKEALS